MDVTEQEALAAKLSDKLGALYLHDLYATHQKVIALSERLQMRFPQEYQHCRLFHVLAGSTDRGASYYSRFDFPDPLSVQAFIEREYEDMIHHSALRGWSNGRSSLS